MDRANQWILLSALCVLCPELRAQPAPIQAGAGYFQTVNADASGNQNEAYYPRVAAPNKVSVTTYPSAPLTAPFRLHSWMGGAMLWATGQTETDGNGYFVAQQPISIQNPGPNQTQTWPSPLFQQGPVIADPIIFAYSQPPNIPNSNPNTRGIQLSLPYPYLAPDVAYASTCGSDANLAPLAIYSDPIPMILLYPSSVAPTPGTAAGDSIWMPTAMLVDNMGDYSVDLIYQNPSSPYAGSGNGSYIKCTVTQGSPYVFFECLGVSYLAVTNQITTSTPVSNLIIPSTAPAQIPTLPTNFQYSLLGGVQIDPGQFAEAITLNPMNSDPTSTGGQACYTTWAVYFNSNAASFTTDPSTSVPQNNYFTITDTTTPFYFAIAALPTIYQYPYTPPTAPLTFANAYQVQTTASNFNVTNYAESLGLYAFNFITDTAVSYSVTNQTFVNTTFTPTLTQRYAPSSVLPANIGQTVMCLMPHQYQPQVFDQSTSLAPAVLPTSSNWSLFSPTGATSLFYWDIRGALQAIAGSSFTTEYIFSNFLPTMPPPAWLDTVTLGGSPYTGAPNYAGQPTTIGQLLFDCLDNEFINNLATPTYAPWNTAYFQQDKGIYDVGKTLAKGAKQLGLLLEFIQGYEDNASTPSSPTYNFFGNGTQPGSANFGPPYFYNTMPQFTSLYEQQFNNPFTQYPSRPGAFDANSGLSPLPSMIQALRTSLQTSVAGSLSPALPGVEGAIIPYFANSPTPCTGGWKLSHFAYYDTVANLVMLYPSAASPSNAGQITPWPGRKGTLPAPAGAGGVFESFGVADAFNDHHYQYGWWISAAALAAIYDGSWPSTPAINPYGGTQLPWADPSNYGTAIDQLVQDIAYDPAVTDFYQDNSQLMHFAKMNFFDQWAGHGWADGIQATIAGGNAGHNENSIGEALQAYASVILWGMATQRQDVVDLGIYLYTTTSYAMDSYFFDKNLNYVSTGSGGNAAFVPTVTTSSNPSYTLGTGFWDYTIHNTSPVTSGTPKIAQGVINYSADFGQTPQNVRVINAFPCNSFSLVFGRNEAYLNAWNAAMESATFCSTITYPSSACWNSAFTSNINMLRALGGNTTALGIPGHGCPASSLTPYQGMVEIFTSQPTGVPSYPFGDPPWGSTGNAYTDPGQSINEVLHFLHIIDHYGTPDWNYYGYSTSGNLVFTAAFTKGTSTTYFAFNPTFSSVTVQFYNVSDNSPVTGTSMTVNPKRWAHVTLP